MKLLNSVLLISDFVEYTKTSTSQVECVEIASASPSSIKSPNQSASKSGKKGRKNKKNIQVEDEGEEKMTGKQVRVNYSTSFLYKVES